MAADEAEQGKDAIDIVRPDGDKIVLAQTRTQSFYGRRRKLHYQNECGVLTEADGRLVLTVATEVALGELADPGMLDRLEHVLGLLYGAKFDTEKETR